MTKKNKEQEGEKIKRQRINKLKFEMMFSCFFLAMYIIAVWIVGKDIKFNLSISAVTIFILLFVVFYNQRLIAKENLKGSD